jgi:hypothetical protein
MKLQTDECSNCGQKSSEVVIVKAYRGNAGLCYVCVLDMVTLLLDEGEVGDPSGANEDPHSRTEP